MRRLVALVTGANGYAGAEIAHALRSSGWQVLTAGRSGGESILMDFSQPESVSRAAAPPVEVEVCIHAAAAHEVVCAGDPVTAMTTNVTGTRALLDWCVAAGIRRFVYLSTFHVFGRNTGQLDEEAVPAPANDYGLTHLLAEETVRMFSPQLDCCILRPSNLLGAPRSWGSFNRWTLAPFDFCLQAHQTGRIVLRSSGTQVRNWLELEALGDLAVRAARGECGDLVHACGKDLSILKLARTVSAAWSELSGAGVELVVPGACDEQKESPRQFVSLRFPQERMPDISSFVLSLHGHLTGSGAP